MPQPPSILCLLLPTAIGFSAFLILHVLVWQWLAPARKGVAVLLLVALVSYLASVTACEFIAHLPVSQHLWTSLPLFAFLVVFYFHLYFGVDRSLSIRILGELARSESGFITLAQLDAMYPKRDMVGRRVEVLLRKGYVKAHDGTYSCTPSGQVLVRLALLGKRVYNLRATG